MLKRKRISLLIFLILISSTIFSVYIYANNGDFPDFTGTGHTGCHNNTPAYLSASGYFDVVLSSGNTVTQDEVFTITLTVRSFTESASEDLNLGFPDGGGRGDNSLWQTDGGLFDSAQHNSVNLDGSGDSGGEVFTLTAPPSTGSYTLVADAIHDEPDGGGADELVYITVNIALTVVTADNSAPSVVFTAPSDNAYVSGSSVLINVTADDGSGVGVDTVWAEITNATYSDNVSMSGTEPDYSGTWDSTVVFDGTYTLAVKANDTAGNLNNTESTSIKVDNSAPSITLDSVIPDPSNGITTLTVFNSSSDIDGNGIRANITDPSLGEIYLNLNYQGSNLWNGTFTVTQNGNYEVNINATDYAGNTGYDGPASITGDVETPIISIVSVLPNPSNGVTTIIASNSSSDIDVNGIWATITTPNFQSIHVDLTYPGGNIWNGTFIITENGVYTVNINTTDNAGNTGYAGPIDITGDIIAPQVNIESPATDNDQIGGSTISISGNAVGTGSNILGIYINDSRWGISKHPQTDPSGSASGPFIFNNNTNIPTGFYWVAINITDQAGNVNVSYRRFEVISFDINPPILVITSINPNPSNGFTNITVISNEPLKAIPLLNITLPSSTVIYRTMILISPLTWKTNYTVVSNGLHTININGTDNADNVGYVSATFTGDVAPPIISIDTLLPNPSNGLVIITAKNLSSDINENGIWATISTPSFQSIFVKLDYQAGNIWNGTFTVIENGAYTVNLNATDYANNTGYAGPLMITGDLVQPSISIVNALPDPSSGLVVITATNSSTDINEKGIWATITTPSLQSIFVKLNYQGGDIWNGTFIVVESGLYEITINATDIAENTGYSGPINISGDVTSPVIDINSPQQDSLIGTNAPAFKITVTEPNLHSTWYKLYNGTIWSNNVNFTGSIGTIETSLWNSMPNEVITIRFYANDTFGKIGTSQINVTKDTINPIINITSPVENQEFDSDVPAFVIDVVEMHFQFTWYSLFDRTSWSNNVSFTGSMGTIEESLWDSMPNGIITIRFYANDTLGNTGYRDVNVTKSTPPPDQNGGVDDGNDIFSTTIIIGIIGSISVLLILIIRGSRTKKFIH